MISSEALLMNLMAFPVIFSTQDRNTWRDNETLEIFTGTILGHADFPFGSVTLDLTYKGLGAVGGSHEYSLELHLPTIVPVPHGQCYNQAE